VKQLESKGLLQEKRALFLARKEYLEGSTKPRGGLLQCEVDASPSECQSRMDDGSLDRRKAVQVCLDAGFEIMRQQAPVEKKKQ